MPAPATADQFLEMVQKSGVVEPTRLDSYLQGLGEGKPSQPQALADLMQRDGLVTPFQVQHFLQGKYLGFVLGKYRILDLLGSGGMSAVYLCEDKTNNKRSAMKVLPRALAKDPIIMRRFYREARASLALDHPNIVRGHEVGQDNNQHFFVMEHVNGPSLQELVAEEGPLAIERAVSFIRQAAVGLQHAFEQGLIHRDIKPGNLLVAPGDVVKVLDMGLSRFYNDEDSILTKDIVGTIDYLAPEQAVDSHAVDIRADVYSLGGTFYYLLTGQSPLTGDTLDPRAIALYAHKRIPIRQLRPETPQALANLIDRMMAFDANKRFPTPKAVAAALQLWSDGKPVPEDMSAYAGTGGNRSLRLGLLVGGALMAIGAGAVVWWTRLR